jgi:hypothetical protein
MGRNMVAAHQTAFYRDVVALDTAKLIVFFAEHEKVFCAAKIPPRIREGNAAEMREFVDQTVEKLMEGLPKLAALERDIEKFAEAAAPHFEHEVGDEECWEACLSWGK